MNLCQQTTHVLCVCAHLPDETQPRKLGSISMQSWFMASSLSNNISANISGLKGWWFSKIHPGPNMEENDISVTWSTSNVVHREEKSQKGITIFKESLVLHMSVFTINSIFKLLFNLCSSFFIYVIFSPKKVFFAYRIPIASLWFFSLSKITVFIQIKQKENKKT